MIFLILITLVTSTRVCLELLMVMALLIFFQMENILLNDQGNALLQLLMIHF